MTCLVDTSVWITYFREFRNDRSVRIKHRLKELIASSEIVMCGMVLAELIQGVFEKHEQRMLSGFSSFSYLETTRAIFESAGRLGRALKNRGLTVPITDCLIAATALAHGCTLVTADRHFTRFPDLKLLLLD